MRILVLLFILFSGLLQSVSAHKPLTEAEKLASTAKIWGFLKYYHPIVGKGKFNWDKELITIIPKVEKATTKEDLSAVYIDWINSLGKVNKNSHKPVKDTTTIFNKNFDLSWLDDQQWFTTELSNKLRFIEENRSSKKNHYAGKNLLGTLNIKNETVYTNFEYPTADYRLLSLFNYWNIIEYFYPYKYQTNQKWDDVLVEMVPKFKNANDTIQYHLAMLELVTKIDDSHAYLVSEYVNQYFGSKIPPFGTKIIDNKAVITSFYNDSLAELNDLQIGDVITKINGQDIETEIKKLDKYIPASNTAIKYRDTPRLLFRGKSDQFYITFERDGIISEKEITRYFVKDLHYKNKPAPSKWKMLDDNIGYVNMGVLTTKDVSTMMDSLMKCKAIIFDVRNYPKGTMYKIANYLNAENKRFVRFTTPDFSYLSKFKWASYYTCGTKNENHYKGKIIVLVNENTQSHAEFTCMSLQTADNVTIIGNQTSGADGNVIPFYFIGGFKTCMTGLGVFYPDGRETQHIGIVPDITIHPTIAGIRQGKDEVLEKAIEVINQ